MTLAKRLFTSVLVVTVVALVVFLCPNWIFSGIASIIIGIALTEFFSLVEKKNIFVYKYPSIILIPQLYSIVKACQTLSLTENSRFREYLFDLNITKNPARAGLLREDSLQGGPDGI